MIPPKISVVVTCYNLGRYLDEAIESVLNQTIHDFDVVIVNDGSTDAATNELLAHYRKPRTRVVWSENLGLSGARNLGIHNTSGLYICCLDADDKLEASYFEKAVKLLDEDPSLTFVSHWLRTFGAEESDWTPTECDLRSMLARNTVNGAALVRREAVLAVGGFDERLVAGCEDWDLWLTLLEQGYRGTIIPEVLFFYRRRSDSMSRLMMNGDTHNQLFRRLVDKHQDSYRRYVLDLVLEKDAGIRHLLKENHDLELEHDAWLVPGLERAREELIPLQAKSARVRQDVRARELEAERAGHVARIHELETERAGLVAGIHELQTERAAFAAGIHELGTERVALASGLHALRAELTDMHDSMSWRVTRPLRAIYGWLRRLGGRR